MTHYTLTADETARYDSDDDRVARALTAELRERFGPVSDSGTEVHHPDGFVVSVHATPDTRWMHRVDGEAHELEDASGYHVDYYPGPGEQHADSEGVWYEVD